MRLDTLHQSRLGTRTRRTAALAAIVCGLAMLPAPVGAQADNLSEAKRRVAEVESRIERGEAAVSSLQSQLRSLAARIGSSQGGLDDTRGELAQTKARITATKARLDELRNRIRSRARIMYKRGPLQLVGIVLGSQDLRQFLGRTSYASQLARHDAGVILEMRREKEKLRQVRAQQEFLERRQASTVAALRSRREAAVSAFARQQAALADLAKARLEATRLLTELKDRLAAGDLEGLRRVAGHGMTISYGAWAQSFLGSLGAPATRANMVVVIAWEAAEGTQATWNPLATTYYMPGTTVMNSHGVRNYTSKEQGIEASIATLHRPNHGYEAIIAGLQRSAKSMETGKAINRSDWCGGCADGTYVLGFIPAVEQYYDRYF